MPDVAVHRIFDHLAHLYDAGWLQRALYEAVQDRALAELRRCQPRSVLDVGCGTGIFAARLDRELAPDGVFGCDLSAGMLAEAAGPPGGWAGCGATRPGCPSGAAPSTPSCAPRRSTSSTSRPPGPSSTGC
jgi:SAM-dependent methyltransferase